jgi:hypothetical protein
VRGDFKGRAVGVDHLERLVERQALAFLGDCDQPVSMCFHEGQENLGSTLLANPVALAPKW